MPSLPTSRTARRYLLKDYSRERPRLRDGRSGALPRVYDLAFVAIAHGYGRVDPEKLSRVAAYQAVAVMRMD